MEGRRAGRGARASAGRADPDRIVELSGSRGDQLVAILLNPPAVTSGTRTRNAVRRAAGVLGHDGAVIVNLCAAPTQTVVQLNDLGRDAWEEARGELDEALTGASAILAGWGVAGLTGDARQLMAAQVDWLADRAQDAGLNTFWMVGGKPRHPSRWHQYVSDKYGRTSGGSFDDRIRQVLVSAPIRQTGSGE